MSNLKLTIGMPHYDDFDGAAFSIQSLLLHHDLTDAEIILVDNSPHTAAGQNIRGLCDSHKGIRNVRYVAMPGNIGPSGAKNAVFENATGDAVLCMDCHVLLPQGAIKRLIDFYDANPTNKDLNTGPLVYDNLKGLSTNFNPVWRGEMWGIWGDDPRGHDPEGEPFEIWGQGCGMFSCRRDAWLGFNPHFRGFGGEEGYIHEKFRQAGHKTMCHPWLRWWHRFGRPSGVKYPLTRWNKVRNYVIGHQELGLALDPIHEHFVKSGLMSQASWDFLIEDPIGHVVEVNIAPASTVKTGQPMTPDVIFTSVASVKRDINEHMPKLRELASQCSHVTEISHRHETFVAFAAAQPKTLVSYNLESSNAMAQAMLKLSPFAKLQSREYDSIETIEPTDLLLLKTRQSAAQLSKELAKFADKVSRFIVLHDTVSHMDTAPDGSPGYAHALRPFVEEHPEWFVAYHSRQQYGLTVLGRQEQDRPEKPIIAWSLGRGPGTELSKLLSDIGINPTSTCSCKAMARDMDSLGVAGCREKIDQIVEGIEKNQAGWNWKEKLSASFKVASSGYFSIKSLVEEAIRRAEASERKGNVAA